MLVFMVMLVFGVVCLIVLVCYGVICRCFAGGWFVLVLV